MVNPLGLWLHILIGNIFQTPLRGLSRFQGIGFRMGYPGIGSSINTRTNEGEIRTGHKIRKGPTVNL